MSFWLESRKRHFHYSLSRCILLEALKSGAVCEYAAMCRGELWLSARENDIPWWWDPLNDISHSLSTKATTPWEPGDPEASITCANEASDDWQAVLFFSLLLLFRLPLPIFSPTSHLWRQKPGRLASYALTFNKALLGITRTVTLMGWWGTPYRACLIAGTDCM